MPARMRRLWFKKKLPAPALPARRLGADQLAEFGGDDSRGGLDLGRRIEQYVGTFEVAGKEQQLGEQDAGSELAGIAPHRGIRGGDRRIQLAAAEQFTGSFSSFWHHPRSLTPSSPARLYR